MQELIPLLPQYYLIPRQKVVYYFPRAKSFLLYYYYFIITGTVVPIGNVHTLPMLGELGFQSYYVQLHIFPKLIHGETKKG